MKDISQFIKESREEIIHLRRDFHAYPELGLAEHRTGKIVADYLSECGLEVCRLNSTGVVGLLRGEGKGPTLLMRADMDALPIQEENEVAYSSTVDGVMHACGYDAHTAMLMVAAKYLCQTKSNLNGNIKFVFEPNEENVGALGMIEEGVLEHPKIDACIGVHVWSPLESGKIGAKAGPVMAGMQHFKITITGKGGHTATPQSAIDPVLVSSAVIQAVQTIQTRELDALNEPAVIMFGSIAGGSAANIIPDSVTLEGTIRYLYDGDDENENSPIARFKRIVKGRKIRVDCTVVESNIHIPYDSELLVDSVRVVARLLSATKTGLPGIIFSFTDHLRRNGGISTSSMRKMLERGNPPTKILSMLPTT